MSISEIRARLVHYWPELAATAVSFLVFATFSGPMLLRQSGAPHFVHQAAGWLQGSLAIPGEPPNLNDWVKVGDRWYSSFPPFPAVLMLPFVAWHGLAFNDVFFTVCLAAMAVGTFVLLLRRLREDGQHQRSDLEIAAFGAFFAFGTVFFPSAIRGEVWFTAHVVGVLLTALYLIASIRGAHPWLAGLVLGCAALTRANLVYAFPFFLLEALSVAGPGASWRERIRRALPRIVQFGIPFTAMFVAALYMNHVRFGSWTEFGHGLLFDNRVNERVRRYGLFSLHFLPENFRSAFLLLPSVQLQPRFRLGFDGNGMSMFLTTPLLLLLPFARPRGRSTVPLVLTAMAIALPGLLYMNNGWYQFGYRFSNDYLPYLFAVLALGTRPMDRLLVTLGLAGVAVDTWGALVFNRPV